MTDLSTRRDAIIRKIASIQDLPSIPDVVLRIMSMVLKDDTDVGKVSALIRDDATLSARVLKIVNSAYFATTVKEITSIRQAVVRLGFAEIYRLCLSVGVARVFEGRKSTLNHRLFWKQSLLVALAAKYLGTKFEGAKDDDYETAYTAGLLSNIGFFLMEQFLHELYKLTQEQVEATGKTPFEIENKLFGINHGEIGGELLKRWNLPPVVSESVTYFPEPQSAPDEYRRFAQIVHVAYFTCNNRDSEFSEENLPNGVDVNAWHDLGLKIKDTPKLFEDVEKEAERSELFATLVL